MLYIAICLERQQIEPYCVEETCKKAERRKNWEVENRKKKSKMAYLGPKISIIMRNINFLDISPKIEISEVD